MKNGIRVGSIFFATNGSDTSFKDVLLLFCLGKPQHFYHSIVSKGVRATHDSEAIRKISMLNVFLFFGFILLLVMGSVALFQYNLILFMADFTMALVFLCLLFYLHKTGDEPTASLVGVGLMFLFFTFLFFVGGVSKTSFMWIYCFPLMALYLLGEKKGGIFIVVIWLVCIAYLILNVSTTIVNVYEKDFAMRFVPSFFAVSVLAWLVEKSRAITRRELEEIQSGLEEAISKRTSELESVNERLLKEIKEKEVSEKERIRLEGELKEAEKLELVGRLAGGVAHDLNNVLSGIVSYPDLILHKLPKDSELRTPLKKIKLSGTRAAAIIDDLFTLARRSVTKKDYLSINRIITDYVESPECLTLQEKYPEVSLTVSLSKNIPDILGSQVHLQKVLLNLLINSYDSIPDAGEVCVSTDVVQLLPLKSPDGSIATDHIVMQVLDSGVGIEPDNIERIFEPFYTSKGMGRRGTGLGMTVVSGVVEDHGGHLTVESEVGKGTTIKVFFPISDSDNADAVTTDDEMVLMGMGQVVLLVDDDQTQLEVGINILHSLNYHPVAIGSGEEAIEYLRDNRADLVLLDMIMDPGLDGLDTFKALLDAGVEVPPTVIVSGYAESDRVEESFAAGVVGFVKKPYTLQDISQAIAQHI